MECLQCSTFYEAGRGMPGKRHILCVLHYSTLSFLLSLVDLKQNFTVENTCLHKNVGGPVDASLPWEMGWECSLYEFLTHKVSKSLCHLQERDRSCAGGEWVICRRGMGHLQEGDGLCAGGDGSSEGGGWVIHRRGMGHLQRLYLQEEKFIICRMLEKFRGNVRKQARSHPKMNQRCAM